jgi:integrase
MWTALAQWASGLGIAPHELTPPVLEKYLQERALTHGMSPRHAWRLLRLFERVMPLLFQHTGAPTNNAATVLLEQRPDLRYANASKFDELPDVLTPAQAATLVRELRRSAASDGTWQERRNAAVTALHLACGITPNEARALLCNQVRVTAQPPVPTESFHQRIAYQITLPPQTKLPQRNLLLSAWSASVLQRWVDTRATLAIPGEMLFPSTKSTGKPWGKVSHYSAVKAFLASPSVQANEASAYTLRHTCALRQLRRGLDPATVAQNLGVTDPDVLERYAKLQGLLLDPAALET